ncbi:MAG TPA: YbhB/YbcL family Raf kinase inhibitor-like protein [Polyangiaceae bacterium]|nr:YbhB/YbcL family Raf kinase inhibitor-like protein [Polyangiaceae bacterium]
MQHRLDVSADRTSLLASRRLEATRLPRIELMSPDFRHGAALPTRATIDGDGTPPALQWGVLDPAPASWLVVAEDPDASGSTPFVHWLVYGIDGRTQGLEANLNEFREGLNDRGQIGYEPAAPPRGAGTHRYCFQLFALDTELTLPEGRDLDRLLSAVQGHVLVWGELVGLYQRP